jgi:hypothetical protein
MTFKKETVSLELQDIIGNITSDALPIRQAMQESLDMTSKISSIGVW